MAARSGICIIPDCDEQVSYTHLQVCSACYSGLTRWRGRSSYCSLEEQETLAAPAASGHREVPDLHR